MQFSFDDDTPQIVTLVPENFVAQHGIGIGKNR